MKKLIPGTNDLKTLFPEVAAEADGWNPSEVLAGTNSRLPWVCEKGHKWKTRCSERTGRDKTGCPYCSNKKCWTGFNDLKTKFPEIAGEVDGWDPSTVIAGSGKKMPWKCKRGHSWNVSVFCRTSNNSGCPYCSNRECWTGFNDLKTKFPEIAKEADGWDPSTVIAGSGKKMPWKCQKGHKWDAVLTSRTGTQKSGCPYCTNRKVWTGFNDLKTKFPEIAKEADGWDPSQVLVGSHKRMNWKCDKGHTWESKVNKRTIRKQGCPYCTNRKVWTGFNDLKTKFPEIAKEADGWDPSDVLAGAHKKLIWKCNLGHSWEALLSLRTHINNPRGCPYCTNRKVWTGFNDLKTLFPEVAKEADGWDPSEVLAGTNNRLPWVCDKGHKWKAQCSERTGRDNTSCPECAEFGFHKEDPAWFYLMNRPGEQQFGITNNLQRRQKEHSQFGWQLLDHVGPYEGLTVFEVEVLFKTWLKENIGVIQGTRENWYTSKMEVHSLSELKGKSGIETSIF